MHAALAAALTTLHAAKEDRLAFGPALREFAQAQRARDTTYNQAEFMALAEAKDAAEKPIQALLLDAWTAALGKEASAGTLAPLAIKGNTCFEDAWTEMLNDGWSNIPQYRREWIANTFMGVQFGLHCKPSMDIPDADALATVLLDEISTGTLAHGPSYGERDLLVNFATGDALHFHAQNWIVSLWSPRKDGTYAPPAQMPRGKALLSTITFPSGRVLVADAVDVGGLRRAILDDNTQAGISVNYAMHRIARTITGLDTHQFFDTHVGSDGPGLVQGADGSLFAASAEEGFPEVANICHDYWGTNIVDCEHIIAHMATKGKDRAEAEDAIADWVAESRYNTLLTLAPGTWHVLWGDDGETVADVLKEAGIAAPKDTQFALFATKPAFSSPRVIET